MNARRNFSEMAFRSGSQPLKSFRPDGVRLEYYRTPCHWCKIPPPGFAFFSIFLLHHRGFVRGFAFVAVVFSRWLVFSSCSCSRVRLAVLSRVHQVWTRVLIHIDNKIIGGSALENSDGVNLPVVRGGSILRVGCLSYCCLGVFIVGGGTCVFS